MTVGGRSFLKASLVLGNALPLSIITRNTLLGNLSLSISLISFNVLMTLTNFITAILPPPPYSEYLIFFNVAKTYFRKIFSIRFLLCCSGDLSEGNSSEKTFVAICEGFHLIIQLIAWPIIYCLKTRSCILLYIKMYIEMFCIFVLYNTVKYLRIQVIFIIFSSIINGSHLGFVCEIWVKFFQRPTK